MEPGKLLWVLFGLRDVGGECVCVWFSVVGAWRRFLIVYLLVEL